MSRLTDTIEDLEDRADKYYDLLYAVHRKFPNETRHETALRYIQNAESHDSNPPQKAERNK